jgi:hypothetical protein
VVVTRDRIRLCTLRSSSCKPGSGRLHAISCGRHCLTGCAPGQEAVDIRTYMEGLHAYAYHFLPRILLTSPVGYTSDTLAVKSVSTASEETYREAKMVPVSANSSSYVHTHMHTYIHSHIRNRIKKSHKEQQLCTHHHSGLECEDVAASIHFSLVQRTARNSASNAEEMQRKKNCRILMSRYDLTYFILSRS